MDFQEAATSTVKYIFKDIYPSYDFTYCKELNWLSYKLS